MSSSDNDPWYILPHAQQLPLAMSVPAAAKLCGLEERAGWWLSHHDWQPFTKRYGRRGILVRTGPLLAWLECDGKSDEKADNTQAQKERTNGHSNRR